MGINDLSSFLKEKVPQAKRREDFSRFRGKRIAIDAENWMYKYMSVAHAKMVEASPIDQLLSPTSAGPVVDRGQVLQHWFQLMLDAICTWLDIGITPVFVFDGPVRPEKTKENRGRQDAKDDTLAKFEQKKAEFLSYPPLMRPDSLVVELKTLARRIFRIGADKQAFRDVLSAANVPCLSAKHDSEELCARLAIEGRVAAVLSRDSDTLAFGCPSMIAEMPALEQDEAGQRLWWVELWDLRLVLQGLGLTYAQFVDMCVLSGCDFNDRVLQLGINRAYQLIKSFKSLDRVPCLPGTTKIDLAEAGCAGWPRTYKGAALDYDMSGLLIDQTRKIFLPQPYSASLTSAECLDVDRKLTDLSMNVLSMYNLPRYLERLTNIYRQLPDPTDAPARDPHVAHLPRVTLKPMARETA